METYFHGTITILQFLTRERIQKYFQGILALSYFSCSDYIFMILGRRIFAKVSGVYDPVSQTDKGTKFWMIKLYRSN